MDKLLQILNRMKSECLILLFIQRAQRLRLENRGRRHTECDMHQRRPGQSSRSVELTFHAKLMGNSRGFVNPAFSLGKRNELFPRIFVVYSPNVQSPCKFMLVW